MDVPTMEKLKTFLRRHAGELIYVTVVVAIASLVLSFVARDNPIVMLLDQVGAIGMLLLGVGFFIGFIVHQLIQLVKLWKQ